MEELKIIYDILSAIWKLCKKYGYKRLDNDEWESFVADGKKLRDQFHQKGDDFDVLFRGMFMALQDLYIRKGMERN